MSSYRSHLPQLDGRVFLTDGGLETTLVFHEGIELPCFAAFDLMNRPGGEQVLRTYFERYASIAVEQRRGIVLETPTWRANPDWGSRIGYDARALADANRRSVALLTAIRLEHESAETPIVISGNIGPRGDGYRAEARMSPSEAYDYHRAQIEVFAASPADMVAAFTMTHSGEAVGIARAARAAGMPVAISFTTETDGRLPSGEKLAHAIEATDHATAGYPAYYKAKVALISIERSAVAWRLIADVIGDELALELAMQLEGLAKEVESEFPQAWAFERPGFDERGGE